MNLKESSGDVADILTDVPSSTAKKVARVACVNGAGSSLLIPHCMPWLYQAQLLQALVRDTLYPLSPDPVCLLQYIL